MLINEKKAVNLQSLNIKWYNTNDDGIYNGGISKAPWCEAYGGENAGLGRGETAV